LGPATFQTPLDGPRGPAQLSRRLLEAEAFEAAEDHWRTVHFGKPLQLLIKNQQKLAGGELIQRIGARVAGRCSKRPCVAKLTSFGGPRLEGGPSSDAM
jgi:hypothetical protein